VSTELHHLAGAYALDALDADERRRFEAHYPTCAFCNDEVHDYRETATMLGAAVSSPPSPELRSRVLEEISRTRQIAPQVPDRVVELAARRRVNLSWSSALVGVAAALLVALIGVVALRGGPVAGPDGELVELLAAGDTTVAALPGDDAGTGTVSVIWSANRNAVAVVATDLAALGEDQTYALWALDDDGVATPSLLFDPDDDGAVTALGDLDTEPARWGITVEPDGGSPAPTGDILYLST